MSRSRRTEARRGVAAIELALVAPVIVLLLLASADIAAALRARMRLDEAAGSLAGYVSQFQQLYAGDFAGIFAAGQTLAGTLPISGTGGATIISGVVNNAGHITIAWQQRTGSSAFTSMLGSAGAVPTFPDGYQVPSGGSVVVAEVFTDFTTWVFSTALMGGNANGSLSSYAIAEPRSALLSQIIPGNRP